MLESTAEEEGREGFGLVSKCSGSADGEGRLATWSCLVWAAGTQEEGGATCLGVGPRL